MDAIQDLETIFRNHDCDDFKWVDPREFVISRWVRMKCTFGCSDYGHASCPPNVPTVSECREFFNEYSRAVVFHFARSVEEPDDRKRWMRNVIAQMLQVEREVFLAGYRKAFVLPPDNCSICKECEPSRVECSNLKQARPGSEALAMDVFATVRQYDYPIVVLTDYDQVMNRYAFLLVE